MHKSELSQDNIVTESSLVSSFTPVFALLLFVNMAALEKGLIGSLFVNGRGLWEVGGAVIKTRKLHLCALFPSKSLLWLCGKTLN